MGGIKSGGRIAKENTEEITVMKTIPTHVVYTGIYYNKRQLWTYLFQYTYFSHQCCIYVHMGESDVIRRKKISCTRINAGNKSKHQDRQSYCVFYCKHSKTNSSLLVSRFFFFFVIRNLGCANAKKNLHRHFCSQRLERSYRINQKKVTFKRNKNSS